MRCLEEINIIWLIKMGKLEFQSFIRYLIFLLETMKKLEKPIYLVNMVQFLIFERNRIKELREEQIKMNG